MANVTSITVSTNRFTLETFSKSLRSDLQEKDVYDAIESFKSHELGDAIEAQWNKELRRKKPSLLKAILRVFVMKFLLACALKLFVETTLIIAITLTQGKVISFFSKENELSLQSTYIITSVLIVAMFGNSIFQYWYLLFGDELGWRIKISLCSLIYRKCVRMSESALIEMTNGRVVNLVSKDVFILNRAIIIALDLWVRIIQMFIMIYIMYNQVEFATIAGILFLIPVFVLEIWIARQSMKFRNQSLIKTDVRLRRIQEILTSIKLLKFYTWEKYYKNIVQIARKQELDQLLNIRHLRVLLFVLGVLSHRISFYLSVIVYVYMDNVVTAEKVFVVLGCYDQIRNILTYAIPEAVAQLSECQCCFKRVRDFLLCEEVKSCRETEDSKMPTVKLKNAKITVLDKVILEDVNLDVTKSLVAITGPVGCGKSVLLKLIMGEFPSEHNVHVSGQISYCSQEPWLFPGTIRQNILFGSELDQQRYSEVIKVCALEADLQAIPGGDNAIVGDKGLNFSKGQQARINLARAIYKRADIYLLDDPLSALDATVGRYVFNHCIKTYLQDKLCLLVCNNKNFLQDVNEIVVLSNGKVIGKDTLNNWINNGIDMWKDASVDSVSTSVRKPSTPSKGHDVEKPDMVDEETTGLIKCKEVDLNDLGIYQEERIIGKIPFRVYKTYWGMLGLGRTIFMVSLIGVGVYMIKYFDVYVTIVLEVEEKYTTMKLNRTNITSYAEAETQHYLTMVYYSVLTLCLVLVVFFKSMFYNISIMKISRKVHNLVLDKIMGASMKFFDQTLSGNILNKFSRDMHFMDEIVAQLYFDCIFIIFSVIGTVIVIAMQNPILLIPSAILFLIASYLRNMYVITCRNLLRISGITRAPMVGHMSATLEGLTTIRANGNQELLIKQFDEQQNVTTSAHYMENAANLAFGLWVEFVTDLYSTGVILSFLIFSTQNINAGDVGLAISQAINFGPFLSWGMTRLSELVRDMTSVERVLEYTKLEQEDLSGDEQKGWPENGDVEYRGVSLKYSNSDNVVLSDLNFSIKPKQKVGIIGRTGAGKSSIISALFRLYKIDGAIIVDGLDIQKLELHTARSNISIIPQDPILFEGTIRSNLDPYNTFSDQEVWNSLKEVKMIGFVEDLGSGLGSPVINGGSNFSLGQKQMLCLARVILKKNKILVLDEATANIDPQTDVLVQQTIKRVFHDCTIITIAHKLSTVIDSDKIIVIDAGKVAEFGSPTTLLNDSNTLFYSLVKNAGLINR